MWDTLSSHFIPATAALTALVGLIGALVKVRPRRLAVWFIAIGEREILLANLQSREAALAESERWRMYWEQQATECRQKLTHTEE